MSKAAHIRRYVIERYIVPARASGDEEIRIRLGDVRQGMRLVSPLQSVCSALGTKLFENEARVELLARIDARAGADTYCHFRILRASAVGRFQRTKDGSSDGDAIGG